MNNSHLIAHFSLSRFSGGQGWADENATRRSISVLWRSCPLSRYSGGGLGWGSSRSTAERPPPLPSPGVPGEGERLPNGELAPEEREELASLVELSETMALVRAQALHLVGRKP